MGRIGRQRKFKIVDPSNKISKGSTQLDYDLPPNTEENEKLPKKMRRITALNRVINKKSKSCTKVKQNSMRAKANENLHKKPGETSKQFLDRLDKQVNIAVNRALIETRTIRSKRKSHLMKRDKKLKSKKHKSNVWANEEKHFDEVNFGEIVSEPPSISAFPRKATAKRQIKVSSDSAKKMSKRNHDTTRDTMTTNEQNCKIGEKDTENKGKAVILDTERNKAIGEYRKMKYRKHISTLKKF